MTYQERKEHKRDKKWRDLWDDCRRMDIEEPYWKSKHLEVSEFEDMGDQLV